MPRYTKLPVTISAMRIPTVAELEETSIIEGWLLDAVINGTVKTLTHGAVEIKTLEGTMRGEPGDYIIQGIQGELYPCKKEIFEATYKPAGE